MSPTEKQIEFVNAICQALDLDFPTCSKQFTKYEYSKFISAHIVDFYSEIGDNDPEYSYLYDTCENDVWTENY